MLMKMKIENNKTKVPNSYHSFVKISNQGSYFGPVVRKEINLPVLYQTE